MNGRAFFSFLFFSQRSTSLNASKRQVTAGEQEGNGYKKISLPGPFTITCWFQRLMLGMIVNVGRRTVECILLSISWKRFLPFFCSLSRKRLLVTRQQRSFPPSIHPSNHLPTLMLQQLFSFIILSSSVATLTLGRWRMVYVIPSLASMSTLTFLFLAVT